MLNIVMPKKTSLTYSSAGVNYELMDPLKRLAQKKARETFGNLSRFGMREVKESLGESAFVWEEPDSFRALVIEGLGTKNLVAEAMRKITGKTYYEELAQDTVAMIVNDLIVVGAEPLVINAYFGIGSPKWFSDKKRATDLLNGWKKACRLSGAVWGGGETPTLTGIIEPETMDLAGSAIGIIKPKERLTLGNKLTAGDVILLFESSGIHANGLTLARAIASKLPKGYTTKLPDGSVYGEALLSPTHIYVKPVGDLFQAKTDIHYMVNITGHGWRKLMRARKSLSYVIDKVPPPQPIFNFIQEKSGNDDSEMYGNFNMGAGLAIFLPESFVNGAQQIAQKNGFQTTIAGTVENGPRKVIIKPKKVVFEGKSLGVR